MLGSQGSAAPEDLTAPALRAFFGLASSWKLSDAEQMKLLGIASRPTLLKRKAGGVLTLSRVTSDRLVKRTASASMAG
jgi:hypothetical protein